MAEFFNNFNEKKILLEIGKNIREIRTKKNWEVKQAAAELGISRQAFENYENGKTDINISTIYTLARIFEVSLSSILPELNGHLINNNIENNHGANISLNEGTFNFIPKSTVEELAKRLEGIEIILKTIKK